ncbi:hypothetical protein HDU78_000407, partial [Chytriomyces hyalinus]
MSHPPHLPHAASIASNESDQNKQHRQQVSVIIHSDSVGLKSTLFTMFTKLNLGATIGPRNDMSTPVIFEGASTLVIRAKEALEMALADKYPGVEVEWGELAESSGQLSKVTVIETAQLLKRQQSSGEFNEADLANLAELSVGASATTEMIKQAVKSAWSQLGTPLGHLTGYIKEKHIDVTYKGVSRTFEISTKTIDDLHTAIHQMFHLNAAISCLFHITENGARAQPTEIGDFIDRAEYYVLTALDQYEEDIPEFIPKFTDMKSFFTTLKSDEDMSDAQVNQAKKVFFKQGITFKQLMKKGDLAITDEALEK